jgi:helix-turn-helix protein
MTPEELVAAVCPLIRDMGWGFFFTPETTARGEELGLDVFSFYALGRGGVLGDSTARVVHSAFGYFNPSLIETMWDAGSQVIRPSEAAHAYMGCSQAHGRKHFSGVEGLDAYCRAAETVVSAADPQGLTLFAGASAIPLPDDLPARAMQLTTVLREFRGSAHLAALVVSGLRPKAAHQIARPEMWEIFGWQESDKENVTDDDRRALEAAEALTDRIVLPAYSAVDAADREPMVSALHAMQAALA